MDVFSAFAKVARDLIAAGGDEAAMRAEVWITLPREKAGKILQVAEEFAHRKRVGERPIEECLYQGGCEDRLFEATKDAMGSLKFDQAMSQLETHQRQVEAALRAKHTRTGFGDPSKMAGVVLAGLGMGAFSGMMIRPNELIRLGNRAEEQKRCGKWILDHAEGEE